MIRPICVPCKRAMRCEQNGCLVNDPKIGDFEATYWEGDKWKCPDCGHEIVAGFAIRGVIGSELSPKDTQHSLQFKP